MPKAARPIIINTKRYNPIDETEIEEDLAPVKDLAKEFQVCDRDVQEKITNAKLTVDENGKRVLVLTGYVSKKDRSKRMVKVGGEFDASNIVAGTRKRKNVNYKSLEEKASKPASKNSFDKRSKLTEKMNKKKAAAKKESEDKENVENQMADDEDIAAEKKTTKKKEEWTYPLSKKNHDLLKKLGGVIKNKLPIRKFRDTEIPAPINAFVSVKFPKNVRFTITKKCVGKNSFGQIEHCLFDLSDNELPQWFKDNEDAVILGESENGLVCAKMSDDNNNFKVYIIFEAIEEGEEEMVFEMSLNKYLSNLKKVKVDVPEEEEETAEEQPAATTSEEQTETAQEESTPSQEEDAPIAESQELVEQSLASDAALNEKVDIMED